MAKPTIEMIVCDLDGTLLDSTSQPTKRNLSALRAAHERGIVCAIASGRDVYSIRRLIQNWQMSDILDLVIGQNGAEIMELSSGRVSTSHLVDPGAFRRVIAHFADMNLNFCIAERGVYLCLREDEYSRNLQEAGNFEVGFDLDFERLLKKPQIKLHLMCNPADMEAVKERAATFNDDRVRGVRTGPYLYEFQHPEVSKANGLPLALELANLRKEAGIMCFGDAENDLEMLRAATVGVAMKNACPDTLAAADYVTDSNDNSGVATFIENWLN